MGDGINNLQYVLITPSRNEARFIEETLKSVVAQTILPLKWVIVNDGSADTTGEIAARYAERHDWIELVNRPVRRERHFAGKVEAFKAGLERVKDWSMRSSATWMLMSHLTPIISSFYCPNSRKIAAWVLLARYSGSRTDTIPPSTVSRDKHM